MARNAVAQVVHRHGPNCSSSRIALHRVMDIRVIDSVHYYWPKGDANEQADGCWVPYADVVDYLIGIEKNTVMENAYLRDQVNAANSAYQDAWDHYDATVQRFCGSTPASDCRFSSQHDYEIAKRAYDLAVRATDYWRCWFENAKSSEYPGHIPHTCEELE